MPSTEGYVIDSCALIDLRRRWYPEDVFESLWVKIETLVKDGRLKSHREVLRELRQQDDEVARWAKAHRTMFGDPDEAQQKWIEEIARDFPNLVDYESARPQADPFVIARALSENSLAVVTSERSGTALRPRIPDVCQAKGVSCLNLLDMFRELGWKF